MEENTIFENALPNIPEQPSLKADIEAAINGLYFLSESDEPFEYIELLAQDNFTELEELLRNELGIQPKTLLERVSFDEFMSPLCEVLDWYGDDEKMQSQRYLNLMNLLQSRLTCLQVIRVGEVTVTIYILGKEEMSGKWAGIKTKSIET